MRPVRSQSGRVSSLRQLLALQRSILGNAPCTLIETVSLKCDAALVGLVEKC